MSQPDSSKCSKRTVCREQSQHGAPWRLVAQLIIAARFLSAKKPWSWVCAVLLMLAIHAPARADKPCSGGEDRVARPIAATLQPNASAFNPNGRFEVTMQSSGDQTTDIYVRHEVGSRELFRTITRLQSFFGTVVVGRLPASEGLGFSLEVAEGGSGLMQICTYGFRFQHGVVSYRALAARAETRGGGIFTGDVTDWKPALTQAQQPPSPPAAGVTGGPQPAPSGVRARIVASVLGETINEGSTLKRRVPLYVGIEVSFRAFVSEDMMHSGTSGGLVQSRTPPVTLHYRYLWFVDGKQFGEGEQFVRWFGGGTYKVEVRADLVSATALSTPQTILPDPQKLRASVLVFVDEQKEWDCKGRLGRGCNDKPVSDDPVKSYATEHNILTSPVTVVPDCTRKGRKGEICIDSMMSVGAIAHDVCCDMHPNGTHCNGKESTSDCQAEWDQATLDRAGGVSGTGGTGLITRFRGTWVYPPDGSDGPSAGKPGWWKGLAPAEAIVSRSETEPTPDQQAICRSRKAKRMARSLMAEGLVTGSPLPFSTIWVCTEAPDSTRMAGMVQNCGRERSLKSTEFSSPTSVEFVNNGPQHVKIYWIDYAGRRVFYNSLGSGQSYIQQTFVTHPWVFTNVNNQCLGIYLPTAQETKVSIP